MKTTSPSPTTSDAADRPLAAWALRPLTGWIVCFLLCLGGTVLTAVGSALGQLAQLTEVTAVWVLAGFVLASAALGLLVMALTRRPLPTYGLRRPAAWRRALWALPIAVIPLIVLLTGGVHVRPALALAYLALTAAVGLSEEIWFRGLALAALRRLGHKPAILGAAAFFGLLHLTNALQGKSIAYLTLQVCLAFLVGVVLGELVEITGSLWIGVAWHLAYDFTSFLGGDTLGAWPVVGLAIVNAILVAFAIVLWRRLPARAGVAG